MTVPSYNQVQIDLKALRNNFRILRSRTKPQASVLAMVKADGYGHGMVQIAKVLREEGCAIFGVAEVREAIALREAGLKNEIYVMLGFETNQAELFLQYKLTPVVFGLRGIEPLALAAEKAGKKIGVHVKIDTGMGRLGFPPDAFEEVVAKVKQYPSLYPAGIISHFSQSDDLFSEQTLESYTAFAGCREKLGKPFLGIFHIANSGGLLNFPQTHDDMVRPGISLYGYYPDGLPGHKGSSENNLTPVMSFTTKILQVKEVPAGTGISYGHTYITTRRTRIATLPVGYEDGYSRLLSNKGEVLIDGQRAPIRGRVCMNLTMVDITGIKGVKEGDEAVLLGRQGSEIITADEIAAWAETISYEVLCMIGNNNQRTYR